LCYDGRMKTNEQIIQLIRQRKFDSARYACIDRLTISRIDAQAWAFLGQAMVGLKRGDMARKCFERVALLDPFANWLQQAWQDAAKVPSGMFDKQTLKLLDVDAVPVSACVLTRDSSRTIRQCIDALKPAVDDIVIVDTGSQDDTADIVESLGLDVHYFEWIDDFSAARNYAQSIAKHDWVITVDSDEILADPGNIGVAASLFDARNMALSVIQLNRVGQEQEAFMTARMYQRSSGMKWTNPIHETLETAQGHRHMKLQTHPVYIRLLHDGYDDVATNQEGKIRRNLRIIEKVLRNDPTNHVFLFYMGRELYKLGEFADAMKYIERAMRYDDGESGFTQEIARYLEQIRRDSTM
jgi:tetratricopeptide (TPR) repeat protein